MLNPDEPIEEFFLEMRHSDEKIVIPEFEALQGKKRSSSRTLYLPLGIAASFLILMGVIFSLNREGAERQEMELVIFLSEEEVMNTETLLSKEITIDSWEATSSSLIDDFNEW